MEAESSGERDEPGGTGSISLKLAQVLRLQAKASLMRLPDGLLASSRTSSWRRSTDPWVEAQPSWAYQPRSASPT